MAAVSIPEHQKAMKRKYAKINLIGTPIAGLLCTALFLLHTIPAWAASIGVFVSIAPQRYFVQKIGGTHVNVSVLVPPGADPHTYEPKPRQMVELSKSSLYFAVGVDFEKAWLKKIAATHPKMRIIHTEEGIAKIPMTGGQPHEEKKRTQGGREPHRAGAPDPHIWLAPALVKIQAGHIFKALTEADPKNHLQYAAGYSAFLKELDSLDAGLKALFVSSQGEWVMVFHPAWGYFADAYGLRQVPVEVEGKEIKAAQLQFLILRARERGVKVIFTQPQLSAKSAELVAREIGGQVIHADPLAENWDANLRAIAEKFRAALK